MAVASSETLGPAPGVQFRGEVERESVKFLTYHFLVSVTEETLTPVSSLQRERFPHDAYSRLSEAELVRPTLQLACLGGV